EEQGDSRKAEGPAGTLLRRFGALARGRGLSGSACGGRSGSFFRRSFVGGLFWRCWRRSPGPTAAWTRRRLRDGAAATRQEIPFIAHHFDTDDAEHDPKGGDSDRNASEQITRFGAKGTLAAKAAERAG